MYSREELYALQATLNGLALLKIAYDAGVPKEKFHTYEVSIDFGIDPTWENFMTSIMHLFDVVEWFYPYDTDNDEEKKYWVKQAGYTDYFESYGVIILMDDRIRPFESVGIGGYTTNEWYTGFGEIFHLDRCILLIFDEDEGPLDCTAALGTFTSILLDSERSDRNEVAV